MKEPKKKKAIGKIILVIIYDYVIRNVLVRILRANENTVITCSAGFDGIRKFEKGKGKFDLVIIDIPQPGIGSLSLAKKIKKINKRTPIILITGRDQKVDRKEGKEIGLDLVLSKPLYIDKTIYFVNDFAQL
jgi:DNA-binding response OmpR family regulator